LQSAVVRRSPTRRSSDLDLQHRGAVGSCVGLVILVVHPAVTAVVKVIGGEAHPVGASLRHGNLQTILAPGGVEVEEEHPFSLPEDRKSTRLNSSHVSISY